MPKTNIRRELKKHKMEGGGKPAGRKKKAEPLHPFYESPQANTAAAAAVPVSPATPNPPPPEPIPIPTTVFEPAAAAAAVLPDGEEEGGLSSSWAEKEMEFKRQEMDRIIQLEEDRVASMLSDPNQLISPFQRIVYLNCRHRVASYINSIKLNSFYYCCECVLFRKITEVLY